MKKNNTMKGNPLLPTSKLTEMMAWVLNVWSDSGAIPGGMNPETMSLNLRTTNTAGLEEL